jgi:hypothetical protein
MYKFFNSQLKKIMIKNIDNIFIFFYVEKKKVPPCIVANWIKLVYLYLKTKMHGGSKTSFYCSFKPDPEFDLEQVQDHGSRRLTHVNLICFIIYI